MKNIIYECETQDPDDFMAVCFLLSHPEANLLAINLTPGSNEQVGLFRALLKKVNRKVLIGVSKINYHKSCVSDFHNKIIDFVPELPDGEGASITNQIYNKFPDTTYIVGSAPYNLRAALELNPFLKIPLWIQQGGFCGSNIVENPLPKFKNMLECQSANVNDKVLVNYLLQSQRITKKVFVSKNICHGFIYDNEMHNILSSIKRNVALDIMFKSMGVYLEGRHEGKAFHDPLAAATLFKNDICQFVEGNLYRKEGKWGFNLQEGTNTFISIGVDKEKAIKTLFEI